MLPDALEQLQVDHWKKLSYSGWNTETKDLCLDFLFPVSVHHPLISGLAPSEVQKVL